MDLPALTGRPVKALTYVVCSLGNHAEGNNTCLRAMGLDQQACTRVAKRTCFLAIALKSSKRQFHQPGDGATELLPQLSPMALTSGTWSRPHFTSSSLGEKLFY